MDDSGIYLEGSEILDDSIYCTEIEGGDMCRDLQTVTTDVSVADQNPGSPSKAVQPSSANPASHVRNAPLAHLLCHENLVDLGEHTRSPHCAIITTSETALKCDTDRTVERAGKIRAYDGFLCYQEDIYQYRKITEDRFRPRMCLQKQPQISTDMRAVLVEWITKLHRGCHYVDSTLYLAVNVMDRFLDTTPISRDCFQLLGITSFLIAAKQEEVFPPEIDELLRLCCFAYNRDQVKQLEVIMLNRLKFDLLVPTASFFLEHYVSSLLASSWPAGHSEVDMRSSHACSLARYLMELTLQDYDLCQFPHSLLAFVVLEVAVEVVKCPLKLDFKYTSSFDSNPEQTKQCFNNVWVLVDVFLANCLDLPSLCEQYKHSIF